MAVVIAGGAWWFSQAGHSGAAAPATAAVKTPALPSGRLQVVDSAVTEVRYLAADEISKAGGTAQATILVMGKGATDVEQRYAMMVRRESIDCAQRRVFDETAGFYDGAGQLKDNAIQSNSIGRPASGLDSEVPVVCASGAPAKLRTVMGWKAAQRETQVAPPDLHARATASPKDADLWAWVCASGARGHWSPTLPKDCDHAVSLNPTSTATLLDRGFLKLLLGKQPAADADFQKAIAMDPQNAGALFGHGLVAALRHDLAASRRDRDHGLDIDPKVPDWIEATYRFQISDPYRSR